MNFQTKSTIIQDLAACSSKELELLKVCAYSLSSFDEEFLFKCCVSLNIKAIDRKPLIDGLLAKKLIVKVYSAYHSFNDLVLNDHVCIQLLITMGKEATLYNAKYKRIHGPSAYFTRKSPTDRADERNFIFEYVAKKKVVTLNYQPEGDFDVDVFFQLCLLFDQYEELEPLLAYLPTELLNRWLLNAKRMADTYFFTTEWAKIDSLLSSPVINEQRMAEIESFFILSRWVYAGNWDQLSQLDRFDSVEALLTKAFLEQRSGKLQEAVKLYQKAIPAKQQLSHNLFYDFAYVCGLMQLNSDKSRSKLSALRKKKELPVVIELLVEIAHSTDLDALAVRINNVSIHSSLESILFEMVLEHYGLDVRFERSYLWIEYLFSLSGFDYLKSLVALTFPSLALQKGFTPNEPVTNPLLPPYTKIMAWERTLDLLLFSKEEEVPKAHRIVYLVDNSFSITPKLQLQLKSGGWSKGRKIALSTFSGGTPEMTTFDHEVAKRVEFEASYGYYSYGGGYYSLGGAKVMKLFVGKNNLYNSAHESVSMEVVLEQPHLAIQKERSGYVIESNIADVANKELLSCEMESQSRIKVTEMSSRQKEVLTLLSRIKHYPLEAKDKLQQLLQAISGDITVHSDLVASDTSIVQVDASSSIVVQLLPVGSEFRAQLYVKPFVQSPPYCVPGKGTKTVMGSGEQASTQAIRNLKAEKANLNELLDALGEFDVVEENTIQLYSSAECLAFLDCVRSLETVQIEWPEGVKLKVTGAASLSNFSISTKGKDSWFTLVGELTYNNDQTIQLNELLDQFAASGNQRFIALGDNEYLALSEQLRKMLLSIQTVITKGKKKQELKVSEFVAPLLRSFQADGLDLKTDASYKRLIKKIDAADKMEFPVPTMLQASLREYQEDGFRWMAKLNEWGAGACLADDMGLGKTVQTIAMLCRQAPHGAALIVAPASVVPNWKAEFERFAPALQVAMLSDAANRAELIATAASQDVVLITYGLLNTETTALTEKHWKTIVLDEAHSIKNKETKISKAAMQLQGDFRILLTGTPVQNHLSEIWNLFQFMNPGMLGSYEQFTKNFINPIEAENNKEKRKELKNLIAPFLLRRTKSEVLDELPGKTEMVITVQLSEQEELFYETLRRKAEQQLLATENNSIQTLAEITRLRQAASHIGLVDTTFNQESVKMAAFFELVEVMKENNHRALVFSQFTSHLALFKEALDKRGVEYLYLDGSTPVAERGKLVKKFQAGNQLLFLISLKAGGLGLNLTAADFIVHLDPWWNPAIEDQASDRAYRIGQTRPVTVYRLIAKNTIEEKIIDLHRTKKDLADSLLDGTNQSHKLTRDELLQLLSRTT